MLFRSSIAVSVGGQADARGVVLPAVLRGELLRSERLLAVLGLDDVDDLLLDLGDASVVALGAQGQSGEVIKREHETAKPAALGVPEAPGVAEVG